MNRDEIVRILDECRVEIQANMAREGVNASGRTSESFRFEEYDGGVRLVMGGGDTAPFLSIEYGNEPQFVDFDKLLQWSADKGIVMDDDERVSFVGALQRRIAREGTLRFSQPNETITTPPIERAVDELGDAVRDSVLSVLDEFLN